MQQRATTAAALLTLVLIGGLGTSLATFPEETPPPRPVQEDGSERPDIDLHEVDLQDVRELTERYVGALNRDDDAEIGRLTCVGPTPGLLRIAASGRRVRFTGRIEASINPDRMRPYLTIGDAPAVPVAVERHAGRWCVRS